MKQTFGIIFIVVGIVTFFRGIATCHGVYETIGFIIGVGLFCGVPAYFCFREPKDKNHANKNTNNANGNTSHPQPIKGDYWGSLLQELIHKCNPKMFMVPYDCEKVEKANELFSQILENKGNPEKLKGLRHLAIENRGVKFTTEKLYNDLCASCNPVRFTNSSTYNPEKLSLANQLYDRIRKSADDIEELERIKEIVEKEGLFRKAVVCDDDNWGLLILFVVIAIFMVILVILFPNH